MEQGSMKDARPEAIAGRALQRLRAALPSSADALADETSVTRLQRVAIASDFAIDTLVRQPELLPRLLADAAPLSPPILTAENRADWPALLRRYRTAESTRLVWRDVLGLDDVGDTLAGATALAETCLQVALQALEIDFAQRHGFVRDRDGRPKSFIAVVEDIDLDAALRVVTFFAYMPIGPYPLLSAWRSCIARR